MPKRGSCGSVLPDCRLSTQYPSINSPAARCCTSRARRDAHCTLLGSPICRDTRRLVLASRLPSRAAPTCDPHSARCSAGCHTSRDFVPWRFLDAGQLSLWSVLSLTSTEAAVRAKGPQYVIDCGNPVPATPSGCHPDPRSRRSWRSPRARGRARMRNPRPRHQSVSCA